MVATISGKLKDSKDQPVSAKMKWEDLETNKEVGESKSDPTDGSFFIALPVGKNYGYFAETEDYYPLSGNVDLRKETKGIQIVEEFKLVSFEELKSKNASVTINNVFFDFGKYDLLTTSILELNRFANIINTFQRKIEISGHTDNVGDDANNLVLSEKRAESVRNYLISIGCSSELLISKGYGESKPVHLNDTDNNRAKNRRVEFKFID
jgi:outer membrane protein OmpA-like peptidoglycan-associated protein